MPRVIVCDVNETLLDVGALEPHFKQAFGDGRVLQDWFANVLLYSEVATLAGPYSDFASIGGAALDMVASARGITLSSADRSRILQGMLTLPAHPDVRDGLQTMRCAGLRLVSNDSAAHPTAVQEGEAAEHLAFDDVVPSAERLANPIRERLVVRHWDSTQLTVCDLLAVMTRVEFHEAHVVLYEHGAEDRRSHPLAM